MYHIAILYMSDKVIDFKKTLGNEEANASSIWNQLKILERKLFQVYSLYRIFQLILIALIISVVLYLLYINLF